MAKAKLNRYKKLNENVLADSVGMKDIYKPKVLLVRQILGLSAQHIAEAFNVVGQAYIDALRSEMIRELDACAVPLSSWRDVVTRVKGRESMIGLN